MVGHYLLWSVALRRICGGYDQFLASVVGGCAVADLSYLSGYYIHYRQASPGPSSDSDKRLIAKTAGPLFLSPKSVPKITQATLFLSVSGFVVVFILLLALKKQTQPASFITESGLGTSGWSDGTAWMIGIGNALYVILPTNSEKIC